MSDNLVDYLRSDRSWPPMDAAHPFCEFDAAVFSLVTYFPLTYVPGGGCFVTHIPLKDYCELTLWKYKFPSSTPPQIGIGHLNEDDVYTLDKYKGDKFKPELDILKYIARIPRYANVMLEMSRVTNDEWDRDRGPESCAQFGAVTFVLPYKSEGSKIRVITFRGTNGTLVGWKDDLYLALDNFSSMVERRAYDYVSDVIGENSDSKFVITGHSKGGYLAVYSFFRYVSDKLHNGSSYRDLEKQFYRERYRKAVFNFDGPGIKQAEIDRIKSDIGSGCFDRFKGMVVVFAPSSAVVSLLLGESFQERTCYVRSNASGFMQHSLRTWVINREFDFSSRGETGPFISTSQDSFSKAITKSISEFLEVYSGSAEDQVVLKQSIDTIFLILENGTSRHQELPNKEDLLSCAKKLCYQAQNNIPFVETLKKLTDKLIVNLERVFPSGGLEYILAIAILVKLLIQNEGYLGAIHDIFENASLSDEEKLNEVSGLMIEIIIANLRSTIWYARVYMEIRDILSS